jgi:predicted membrane protein
MSYRTPKVLEKKPLVAGQDLQSIVVIATCFLLFLFTVFSSFILALLFLAIGAIYIKIQNMFPNKGQLITFIKYKSTVQCTRVDTPITKLLKRNQNHPNKQK